MNRKFTSLVVAFMCIAIITSYAWARPVAFWHPELFGAEDKMSYVNWIWQNDQWFAVEMGLFMDDVNKVKTALVKQGWENITSGDAVDDLMLEIQDLFGPIMASYLEADPRELLLFLAAFSFTEQIQMNQGPWEARAMFAGDIFDQDGNGQFVGIEGTSVYVGLLTNPQKNDPEPHLSLELSWGPVPGSQCSCILLSETDQFNWDIFEYETSCSPQAVADYYEQSNGWAFHQIGLEFFGGSLLGDRQLGIVISPDSKSGKTKYTILESYNLEW
ncbi:MAG: hypothetical protein GX316_02980 [Firmicutes bacterium]|nr:hypothetical protein [Bacillota bacterium]